MSSPDPLDCIDLPILHHDKRQRLHPPTSLAEEPTIDELTIQRPDTPPVTADSSSIGPSADSLEYLPDRDQTDFDEGQGRANSSLASHLGLVDEPMPSTVCENDAAQIDGSQDHPGTEEIRDIDGNDTRAQSDTAVRHQDLNGSPGPASDSLDDIAPASHIPTNVEHVIETTQDGPMELTPALGAEGDSVDTLLAQHGDEAAAPQDGLTAMELDSTPAVGAKGDNVDTLLAHHGDEATAPQDGLTAMELDLTPAVGAKGDNVDTLFADHGDEAAAPQDGLTAMELDLAPALGAKGDDVGTLLAHHGDEAAAPQDVPAARSPPPASPGSPSSAPIAEAKIAEPTEAAELGETTTGNIIEDDLLCLCRVKFDEEDEEGIMVACDGGCEGWYHPGCIGMSEEEVQRLDQYICAKCEKVTSQRTAYQQLCLYNRCGKAMGQGQGKYCSSHCAYNHMAERIPATPSNKLLKQISAAFAGLPRPSKVKVVHHETVVIDAAEDAIRQQLQIVEKSLVAMAKRRELVDRILLRAESLAPLQSSANAKPAKKKGSTRSSVEDRPCGWSSALAWTDDQVLRSDDSAEMDVCTASRRRCDRHGGWQRTAPLLLAVEERELSQRKEVLMSQAARNTDSKEQAINLAEAREALLKKLGVT